MPAAHPPGRSRVKGGMGMHNLLRLVLAAVVSAGILLAQGGEAACAGLQNQEAVSFRGLISFRLASGGVRLMRPSVGSAPVDVSGLLDAAYGAGTDIWLNISPDGRWLLLETERFGCDGWPCMARLSINLDQAEVLQAGAEVLHAEGFSAIASGGELVVFTATDGPHDVDLYVTTRGAGGWSTPVLLTQNAAFARNEQPAIAADGRSVLFNCKDVNSPATDSVCEVGVDGANLRVVATPADAPAGVTVPGQGLHHPDYAAGGDIVYEGDWGGETLYRLPSGATVPVAVNAQYNNDNSPCVLPDGAIASLWLDRPGGQGLHELKVMDADGSDAVVLLPDQDVFDLGLGCGVDRYGSQGALATPWQLLLRQGQ